MKKIFTFLFSLLVLSVGKSFSQADSCVILGCAGQYTGVTTNNALPFLTGGYPGTCYAAASYKQIFWQFLFVDGVGFRTYAQSFTPQPASTNLDIDWVVYL